MKNLILFMKNHTTTKSHISSPLIIQNRMQGLTAIMMVQKVTPVGTLRVDTLEDTLIVTREVTLTGTQEDMGTILMGTPEDMGTTPMGTPEGMGVMPKTTRQGMVTIITNMGMNTTEVERALKGMRPHDRVQPRSIPNHLTESLHPLWWPSLVKDAIRAEKRSRR